MKSLSFRKDLVGVQDELLRFAYKLTTDREEANDLLQETSLKALDNEDKYSNILFIILAKHVPVIDKKNDTTHIRHEFAIVFNTKNLLKYKDQFKKFVFSIELGSVNMIEKENDESYLNIGDNLKISNSTTYVPVLV